MKQTLISASIVAMLSSGAIAGNIDTATADPVITPPTSTSTVTDWSGGYVGLSYSSVDGTMEYSDVTYVFEYLQDSAIGVFAGYNWQSGNLVYGGELNVTEGLVEGRYGSITQELDNTIELRARAGYATGDMLAYGFLGYGMSDWTGGDTFDVAGVTYGLGVDYMVTTSIFAGLEFSHRELSGQSNGVSWKQTSSIDMISLRIGYNY